MSLFIKRKRPGSSGDESETLQTDVMRFIAILNLCLMIIFALVQAIPVSSKGNTPNIQSRELLQHQINALRMKIDSLKVQIKDLEEDILEQKNVVSSFDQIIAEKEDEIRSKEDKQERAERKLKDVENTVRQANLRASEAERKVAAAEKDFEKKNNRLAEVVQQTKQAGLLLKRGERVISEARKKLDQVWSKADAEKQEDEEFTSVSNSKVGFSLAFASESALKDLIREGKITYYLMAGKHSWKLSVGAGGTWNFLKSGNPGKIYEMTTNTIPYDFLKAARKVLAGAGSTQTFGVMLPLAIENKLQKIMGKNSGGNIIIDRNGSLSLSLS